MEIVFQVIEDIKKGEFAKLDFATGELSISRDIKQELQLKKEPNIIKNGG